MLEILAPYMDFIMFIVAISLNVLLIFLKSEWYVYLIVNVIYVVCALWLGLSPYGFIGKFLEYVWERLMELGEDFLSWLNPFDTKVIN